MCAWNCKDIPNPCQSNKKGKDTLRYQHFVQNSGFFDLEDLQHDSMTSRCWKQPLTNKNHSMLDFQGLFPFRNRGLFMATRLTHFHIVNQKFTLNNNRWQDSKFVLMKIMNSQPQKLPQNKAKSNHPPVVATKPTGWQPPGNASVDSRNS